LDKYTDEDRRVESCVEKLIGGAVVSLVRESRWRPSWIATVRLPGKDVAIYVRGDRGEGYSYPLDYEANVLEVLEENGVPVPHVYGMCEDPPAIVMDCVPGERQLTGLVSDESKRAVIDDYIAAIVRMHRIEVRQFEQRGLRNPPDPGDLQQNQHRVNVDFYRTLKARPEPLVEFVLRWMDRNVPRHRPQRSFVTYDSGQFLVDQGRVSAIYDLEVAHINDPLVDLGGWRIRDTFEPLYDLGYMYREYARLTGEDIDHDVINYHVMALSISTSLCIAKQITQPLDTAVNWLVWEVAGTRMALTAMADILKVDLGAPHRPEPQRSARSHAAESMKLAIHALPIDRADPSTSYRLAMASNLAAHLELVDHIGGAIDKVNLDEVEALIGYRPASLAEADVALEKYVLAAGPEKDVELLQLFFRRNERNRMLLPVFTEGVAAGDVSPFLDNALLPPMRDVMGDR